MSEYEHIDTWTTSEGNDIPIEEISDYHLKNILRMLSKRKEKDMSFATLCMEAKRRDINWKSAR